MAIQAVIDDISLSTGKPAVERRVGIVEYFFPGLKPDEFFSALLPKARQVEIGLASNLGLVGYIGGSDNLT